ncbi:hypothetical protein V1477_017822 [Vespula maculifrons]|uniref:Ribosomal protein S3 n=1 Tax=Vespula maculifrons TaxID=7453 RepID=A0ABD2AZG3_VESMC
MEKKHFSLTIFFSETIAPRRTGVGSLERARHALYAHIFFVQIGLIGADTDENLTGVIRKDSSRPLRPYFFIQIGPTGADTQENRTRVIGKGPSRPLRPYFFRPDRTNRSQVITHLGEPDRGHWKGLAAPWNKGKKHFPLTIFFSETIAPRRTGPGTQKNRSGVIGKGSSRPLRPYFFRPDRTNRSRVITEPSYNGLKGTKEKNIVFNNFFLRNCSTQENLTGVIEKDSSRPLRPYFFRPDLTNRSRVIKEPSYNGLKEQWKKTFFFNNFFLRNYSTEENRTGVIGKESSRPLRPYFFRPDRTNRSRVITRLGEPDRGHWKGLVAPSPRRTSPGSLERTRRAPYVHIFFFQIGPIGAETQENRSGVIGKDSSRPLRPYFFLPDWTNRSRVITHLEEPDRGHWKGLVAPSTPIFFSSRSDQ